MLIKFTVFLTAAAMVWFLFAAVRLRLKNADLRWFGRKTSDNDEGIANSSDELSIPYLEELLKKFERKLEIISRDFVSMNPDRKQKAIARIREIKEKIIVVKEVIEQINDEGYETAVPQANNISRFQKFWKSSITSFAFQRPSSSNWLYVSSSHNGLYRTVHFGNRNDKSN